MESRKIAGFTNRLFGANIRFNSNRCGLTFDAESLAVAISTSDPVAQDVFRRECDRILANDNYSGAVSERVVQLLLFIALGISNRCRYGATRCI